MACNICYIPFLYVIDFKGALDFGEAQLQDAGPGKIEVNIVIEDGEDHRKAEGRRRAYDLDSGQAL
jgi:hypothetical protein